MIWFNAILCLACAYTATHGERGALGFVISLQTIGKLNLRPHMHFIYVDLNFGFFYESSFNLAIIVNQLRIFFGRIIMPDSLFFDFY